MEITLNEQSQTVPGHFSVQDLMNVFFPGQVSGIALAINQEIIPRSQWTIRLLAPRDSVTLIKATPGG